KLPSHSIAGFPEISWLGVYPTWETLIAQVLLLALIISQTVRVKQKQDKKQQKTEQQPSRMAQ
ncbi:hypothetical protein, partial [Halobacillus sp. BBL2006]|uniref:hypothetical protein n=1 Tax=Halobacillus sp. BBL2006 TaxID=1543706 RepID=UPI0005435863